MALPQGNYGFLTWQGEPVMASLAYNRTYSSPLGDAQPRADRGADFPELAKFRIIPNFDCQRSLAMLIENEIIPRLMVAHSSDATKIVAKIDVGEIDAVATLALQIDADALLRNIEAILARGVAITAVMVDLLAPAARRLGEYWEDDRCDFVDVTMGLWRLQEVVREIAARAPARRLLATGGRRALFASMPGDQHNLGIAVIDEMFRRDGWVTDRLNGAEMSDLLKSAGGDWFDIIGLTATCDCHIAHLASIIVALRNVSLNPRVCVMVGGPVFNMDPELAATVGADATAPDARLAVKVAAGLVRSREREALATS